MDLQEDEIELANKQFRDIYYKLIAELNEKEDFSIKIFISDLNQEMVSEISSILMEEDKIYFTQLGA